MSSSVAETPATDSPGAQVLAGLAVPGLDLDKARHMVDVRAARRHKEVTDLSYETVAADLARRDALDQGRSHDPLRTADDAVIIDTSDLGVDEIVAAVVEALP